MKKIVLILTFVFLFMLTACKEQTPIEECTDDPSCYIIEDPAFDLLMEERGITGGTMTTLEMEEAYQLLEQHYLTSADTIDQTLYPLLQFYLDVAETKHPDQIPLITELNERLDAMYTREIFMNNILNFRAINTEMVQYTILNGVTFLIYKTADHIYQYEVNGTTPYIFILNTEEDTLYLNDELVTTERDIAHEFINEEYLFSSMNYAVINNVIYYDFDYLNGYLVGAYNIDTESRYEIIFNDDSFDIIEYSGLLSVKSRLINEEFSGTVSEFFVYIVDPLTPFPGQFEPFISTIAQLYQVRTVSYPLDFTN